MLARILIRLLSEMHYKELPTDAIGQVLFMAKFERRAKLDEISAILLTEFQKADPTRLSLDNYLTLKPTSPDTSISPHDLTP